MKRLIYAGLFLVALGTSACEKELMSPTEEVPEANSNTSKPIGLQNGSLVFESASQMYDELEILARMTPTQRIDFENKLGFRSLGTLLYMINKAEVENLESFYKGVDPNLSQSQYQEMGYRYQNSELYAKYLEKGVLLEHTEPDGSRSFELSIENPGFVNVLNEDGVVFAGNEKYEFEGSNLRIYNRRTGAMVHQVSFGAMTDMTSNWSNAAAWEYDGNDKRFNYKVYGTCITSSTQSNSGLLQTSFYVQARAENLRFGTWAGRSSYMPIYSFNGSWTANYTAASCAYCWGQTNPVSLIDNDYSSPYAWHSANDPYGQTNNFLRYFKPNGSWALTGWYIMSAFDVHYTMTFNFSGGTSGYSRTFTR